MRVLSSLAAPVVMFIILAVSLSNVPTLAADSKEVDAVVYVFTGGGLMKTVEGVLVHEDRHRVTLRLPNGKFQEFGWNEIANLVRKPSQDGTDASPDSTNEHHSYDGPATVHIPAESYGRKAPALAFLFSVIVPGGGQFYNGEPKKGLLQLGMVVGGMVAWAAFFPTEELFVGGLDQFLEEDLNSGNAMLSYGGLTLAVVGATWSLIDAPMSADRINRSRGLAVLPESVGSPTLNLAYREVAGDPASGVVLDWRF